jgi:hypothetical protein
MPEFMTPEEEALAHGDAETNAGFYNRLPAEDAEAAFDI